MKNLNYVIAFPDSRNDTRYVNGKNKGADNPACATFFDSIEDAEKEIEKIKAGFFRKVYPAWVGVEEI